jgi:putative ABC transport system permease protein
MSLAGFILRNATRNRRRLALTLGSVAMSLFLLVLLQVVQAGLTAPDTTDEAALRLVVRHKVSLANMLPARHQARVARLPGVAAMTPLVWFGGIYRDEKNFFPQFACDAASLFRVLVEAKIDPRQLDQFVKERTACVVGARTMQRFGWKVGDRITLLGAMWPCDLELTIRGVYAGTADETHLYFHHEYFDELLGDQGFTGLLWVRADSAASATNLLQRIDAEFASTDAETLTETEHAFQIGFVSMLGNVKVLIGSISTVIVFTLVLVTAGTMSMAIRERVRELAVLKGLGFAAGRLFSLMLAESFGLAMAGGVLGCAGVLALVRTVDFYKLSRGLFVNFEVSPEILARGLAAAAALGVVSCLWPAWSNARRSVADGLRTVD